MNKSSITDTLIRNTNKLSEWGNKNLPRLLEVAGVIFFGLTVYKSAQQAPKVKPALEKAEEEKGEPLTTFEKAKTVGNVLKEPVFYAAVAISCNHAAINIMDSRLATVMAAAGLKQSHADSYILAAREYLTKNEKEKAEDDALINQLDHMLEKDISIIVSLLYTKVKQRQAAFIDYPQLVPLG